MKRDVSQVQDGRETGENMLLKLRLKPNQIQGVADLGKLTAVMLNTGRTGPSPVKVTAERSGVK